MEAFIPENGNAAVLQSLLQGRSQTEHIKTAVQRSVGSGFYVVFACFLVAFRGVGAVDQNLRSGKIGPFRLLQNGRFRIYSDARGVVKPDAGPILGGKDRRGGLCLRRGFGNEDRQGQSFRRFRVCRRRGLRGIDRDDRFRLRAPPPGFQVQQKLPRGGRGQQRHKRPVEAKEKTQRGTRHTEFPGSAVFSQGKDPPKNN